MTGPQHNTAHDTAGEPAAAAQRDRSLWRVIFFNPRRNPLTSRTLRPRSVERLLIALLVIGILLIHWVRYYDMKHYFTEVEPWDVFSAGFTLLILSEIFIWCCTPIGLLARIHGFRTSGWMDELRLTFLSPAELLQLQCAPSIRFLRRVSYCAGVAGFGGLLIYLEAIGLFVSMFLLLAVNSYVSAHTACWLVTAVAAGVRSTPRAVFALAYLALVMGVWLGLITVFGFVAFATLFNPEKLPELMMGISIWLALTWLFKIALARVYITHFSRHVYPSLVQ